MAACKLAYEYLEKNNMLPSICAICDEIGNPNRDDAFEQTYDDNGNPIWNCECQIAEEDCCFDGTSSSKKGAKKDSAFRMLLYVLGKEED